MPLVVLSVSRAGLIISVISCLLTTYAESQNVPTWRWTPVPVLRLGEAGSPAHEFDRLAGAVRLTSGDVVVLDGATQELRVFAPDGTHLRTLSRAGNGPGELTAGGPLFARRDTLFVIERPPGTSQLHVFHPLSGYITRHRIAAAGAVGALTGIAILGDGALLVMRGGMRTVTPPPPGALARDSVTLGIVGDSAVIWLGTWPGTTWLGYRLPPGSRVATSLTRFPFGGATLMATSADRVWVGDSESGIIQAFDEHGRPVGQVRHDLRRRRPSREAIERSRRQARESAAQPFRAAVDAVHDRAAHVPLAPAISALIGGEDGELWIIGFRESELEPADIVIVNRSGAPIGRLRLPPGLRPMYATRTHLVGIVRDADEVEQVVVHRIRR